MLASFFKIPLLFHQGFTLSLLSFCVFCVLTSLTKHNEKLIKTLPEDGFFPWGCSQCSEFEPTDLHTEKVGGEHGCLSCASDLSRLSVGQVQPVPLFWCWGLPHTTAPWSLIHSGTDAPLLLLPHTLWTLSIWKNEGKAKSKMIALQKFLSLECCGI